MNWKYQRIICFILTVFFILSSSSIALSGKSVSRNVVKVSKEKFCEELEISDREKAA